MYKASDDLGACLLAQLEAAESLQARTKSGMDTGGWSFFKALAALLRCVSFLVWFSFHRFIGMSSLYFAFVNWFSPFIFCVSAFLRLWFHASLGFVSVSARTAW